MIFVSRVFGRSRSRLSEADLRDFLHGSSWYNLIKSRIYGGAVPLRALWTRRHILYLTRSLNLIFLDFEILRVKVWVHTVITGKHRFLKVHISG